MGVPVNLHQSLRDQNLRHEGLYGNAGRPPQSGPKADRRQLRNRALDLILGAAVIGLCLPLLLVAALATVLCNRCVVFKTVSRVTDRGRAIAVLNFRLNRTKIGDRKHVNGFSRFLMRSRLVALPEIINVLTGELSFFDPDSAAPSLFDA
ncbi:MAG: sugar transferase [Alphaproteobacteria bacterium]|nr:sugar transferase [Alphaproteobacteria bacterium]